MPDPSQDQNVVDPKQVLLALLSRSNRMLETPGAPNPGGATPPFFPQPGGSNSAVGDPGGVDQKTRQMLFSLAQNQQQPSAQPQQQPKQTQSVSQLPPIPQQAPFQGTFGNRQGIISQIVNAAEKRSHDKKVNEAEMYYNQINSFLAAGDQDSAHRLLDDPKVRKVLKAGLDYQPLTEEPPPEALGINKAQQKINQKQNMLQKIQQMIMPRPQQQPPGRAVIPGPSQQATQAQQLEQAKIGAAQAEAGKYTAEAGEAQARTAALGPEAEARKLAAQAEADRAQAEVKRAEAEAKQKEALTPFQEREYNAKVDQLKALSREADAHARYFDKGGKLPGSAMQNLIKSARSDLYSAWKDAQSTKNTVHKEIQKQESGFTSKTLAHMGITGDARQGAAEADKQFTGLTNALKWWDGEGLQKIQNGEMSPSQALAQAYKIAGIEAPPPSNPSDSGDVGGFVMQPDGTYVER